MIEALRTEDETTKIIFSRVPACIKDQNLAKYACIWDTLVPLDGQLIQRSTVGGQSTNT